MILMKTNVLLLLFMFFSASTLFSQSKKELDLRIDTLQTELNSENLKVQNLNLQLQNLTSELTQLNSKINIMASQVVKQDSMNTLLENQLHDLLNTAEGLKRTNDSIINAKEKFIIDSTLQVEKKKNQHIQDSIQVAQGVIYCYKSSSSEIENEVTYTSIVEITITIKNGIVKGNYSNIIQRDGHFMQGDNNDLTGKVINNVIQAVVASSHTEQVNNWQKTGKKNIKLVIGETIKWDGIELKKCDK
jgi:hypothetical protein